ncbi:hypothetical protein JCM10207_007611 [Rhodosporidiobolus poonsookiae]
MLSSPARSPAKRRTALLIALSSVVFHLWLAGKLTAVREGLSSSLGNDDLGGGGAGDDARDWEGAETRRLGGVHALLGIARWWSLCSTGIAGVGLYGLAKDRLPFIRIFVLNSFLTLALDVLLLALILLLLTVSAPSTSSASALATTLCQAISTSPSASSALSLDFGLPDLLGLSLEACEDRFDGILVSALATLSVVEGARTWAALKLLAYYGAAASRRSGRSSRPGDLSHAGRSERYYDEPVELDHSALPPSPSHSPGQGQGQKKHRTSLRRERSRTRSWSGHGHPSAPPDTRILLLPRPEDRAGAEARQADVPLLALTASSPVSTSFPPGVQQQPTTPRGSGRGEKGKVLVYAPVYMSPEEARTCGATELFLHEHRRSHRSSGPSSSSSSTAGGNGSSARSRSGTIIAPPSTPRSALTVDTAAASTPKVAARRQDSDDLPTPVALRPRQGSPPYSVILCETPDDLARCLAVRAAAFGADGLSAQVDAHAPESKVGRCATLPAHRGTGAGRLLCLALEDHLQNRRGKSAARFKGLDEVELWGNAVKGAEGFYEKLGFTVDEKEFLEHGEPHRRISKQIKLNPEPPQPTYETLLCSTKEDLARCLAIRYQVFCVEQGYDPKIEVDDRDVDCDHFLLIQWNADRTTEDVGTIRWFAPQSKLGRFAIHSQYRGIGAGKILATALEEHIRQRQGRAKDRFKGEEVAEIVAYSQKIAEGFYLKTGWVTDGPDFIEEGQPHVKVVKRIPLVPDQA